MPPKKVPTLTPDIDRKCGNCAYATGKNGSTMMVCGIDLPPMVNVSSDPRRHMVNQNYSCFAWKSKSN